MSADTVAIAEKYHGTVTGYTYGCRCDRCKAAHSTALREYRADHPQDTTSAYAKAKIYEQQMRREERGLAEGDSRHGTKAGYDKWGCRCERCRAASREYSRRHRAARQRAKAEQSC